MAEAPWYKTTLRWGQTNLVECDPARYDADWWREHWRRTRVQGIIVNAGGIVAYYPSQFPLHHRAETHGERDLYGDIVKLAREEGLTVREERYSLDQSASGGATGGSSGEIADGSGDKLLRHSATGSVAVPRSVATRAMAPASTPVARASSAARVMRGPTVSGCACSAAARRVTASTR